MQPKRLVGMTWNYWLAQKIRKKWIVPLRMRNSEVEIKHVQPDEQQKLPEKKTILFTFSSQHLRLHYSLKLQSGILPITVPLLTEIKNFLINWISSAAWQLCLRCSSSLALSLLSPKFLSSSKGNPKWTPVNIKSERMLEVASPRGW